MRTAPRRRTHRPLPWHGWGARLQAWLARLGGRAATVAATPEAAPRAAVDVAVDRPHAQAQPTMETAVAHAARRPDPAREMATQVRSLLDGHPRARDVFRHLGLLERALRSHGMRVFDEMSARVIGLALRQLEALVSEWNPTLSDMRRRMTVRLLASDGLAPPPHVRSAADARGRTQVSEVAMEDYVDALARYEATMPMPPGFEHRA